MSRFDYTIEVIIMSSIHQYARSSIYTRADVVEWRDQTSGSCTTTLCVPSAIYLVLCVGGSVCIIRNQRFASEDESIRGIAKTDFVEWSTFRIAVEV